MYKMIKLLRMKVKQCRKEMVVLRLRVQRQTTNKVIKEQLNRLSQNQTIV